MKEYIGLVKGCADSDFAKTWVEVCQRRQRAHDQWIAKLRSEGIAAAHPEDGWVDRKNNTIKFTYQHFNDGVMVGSRIAIGSPEKFRIVTITAFVRSPYFSPGLDQWAFSTESKP